MTVTTKTITTHLGTRPTQPANHVGYSLQGCYMRPDGDGDIGEEATMPLSNTAADGMTIATCLETCVQAGLNKGSVDSYAFAAVGEGRECYCTTNLSPQAISVDAKNCSIPCVGDKSTACGGMDHIAVYSLVDASAAARYATAQGLGTGDPGTPGSSSADGGSAKNGSQAVAIVFGSLAGCTTMGLMAFLGCKLYRRRKIPARNRNRSLRTAKGMDKNNDDGVLVIGAPATDEDTVPELLQKPPRRPLLLPQIAGLGSSGGQPAGKQEIMRIKFVQSTPNSTGNWGLTSGSTLHRQPAPMCPLSPLSPTDDGLRQRRRSSIKPVDWARFDAVITDGQFLPLNNKSPIRERFPANERSRRGSITVYGSGHGTTGGTSSASSSGAIGTASVVPLQTSSNGVFQAYHPERMRASAWSDSTAEPSPRSINTVDSSILDVSPETSTTNLDCTTSNRSRRRLNTPPFPMLAGSPTSSHSSGSRRSSLAEIVGDYNGVRVGRVEELRDGESRDELVPGVVDEEESPILPVSSGGMTVFKKVVYDGPRALPESGRDTVVKPGPPVVDEPQLVLPATTYDGGALAAGRRKKMV